CAFGGVGGENRRIDQNEVALVEEIAASLLDFAADPQDRVLFRGAQPKMANVHQERGAMLLRRNWIVLRERDDLERFDSQLDSARCASFRADASGDAHRRFLRRLLDRAPSLFVDFLLHDDALQITAAIANNRKLQLASCALVVQPAADGDLLADAVRKVFDAG